MDYSDSQMQCLSCWCSFGDKRPHLCQSRSSIRKIAKKMSVLCQIVIVYYPFTVHNPSTLQSGMTVLTSVRNTCRNSWTEGEGCAQTWNDHICLPCSPLLENKIISGSRYKFSFNNACSPKQANLCWYGLVLN